MGPEGAVSIINRVQIAEADNPEKLKTKLAKEYRKQFAHPYIAAGRGYIDDIIDPVETRPQNYKSLGNAEKQNGIACRQRNTAAFLYR